MTTLTKGRKYGSLRSRPVFGESWDTVLGFNGQTYEVTHEGVNLGTVGPARVMVPKHMFGRVTGYVTGGRYVAQNPGDPWAPGEHQGRQFQTRKAAVAFLVEAAR